MCKLNMSDLASVTHHYQKAAPSLPALKSTWISQSLSAEATNGFPENASLAAVEGSVASGSNLIGSFLFLFCSRSFLIQQLVRLT